MEPSEKTKHTPRREEAADRFVPPAFRVFRSFPRAPRILFIIGVSVPFTVGSAHDENDSLFFFRMIISVQTFQVFVAFRFQQESTFFPYLFPFPFSFSLVRSFWPYVSCRAFPRPTWRTRVSRSSGVAFQPGSDRLPCLSLGDSGIGHRITLPPFPFVFGNLFESMGMSSCRLSIFLFASPSLL